MIIIFNFFSLIVVILALGLSVAFQSILGANHELTDYTFWLSMILLSCVAEGIGVRPRVYFLPLWIISIVVAVVSIMKSNPELISICIGFIVVSVGTGIWLRLFLDKRRFESAQKNLDLALKNKNFENLKKSIFYPSSLYPVGAIVENNFGSWYEGRQRKWYFRPDVHHHYTTIMNLLKAKGELSKNNLYLDKIFQGEAQSGVPKYLIDQILNP